MNTPLFIALEGIDGSGKSTQASLLAAALEQQGHKVWRTCEPTHGDIGQIIRRIFKHEKIADHRTITTLFAADRLEHILSAEEGLLAKLEAGYTVVCDRYYFSSYAYHSVHCPMDWVMDCNKMAAATLRPDLTLFIDVPPELCMQRIAQNRSGVQLYESLENLQAVRAKYLEAFEQTQQEERVQRINGEGTVAETAALVMDAVAKIV